MQLNSCSGGFSLKIYLTNSKAIKYSYFCCGTEEQIIYHLIKTEILGILLPQKEKDTDTIQSASSETPAVYSIWSRIH